MPTIKISLINASYILMDSDVQIATDALQTQVSQHFAPAWGIDAQLQFIPTGMQPPQETWWLVFLDDSDTAGALGYHDLTPQGLPLGKVFAGTDKQYNDSWTVTASHELLEMLGDPDINLSAFVQTSADEVLPVTGRMYAYEVCDACEADQYGYKIDGVLVSDFVYPAWFEAFRQPGSTRFDYQSQISRPFGLLPGGYISVLDLSSSAGWQQLQVAHANGSGAERSNRAPVGSRRERRRTPRQHWRRSDIHRTSAHGRLLSFMTSQRARMEALTKPSLTSGFCLAVVLDSAPKGNRFNRETDDPSAVKLFDLGVTDDLEVSRYVSAVKKAIRPWQINETDLASSRDSTVQQSADAIALGAF